MHHNQTRIYAILQLSKSLFREIRRLENSPFCTRVRAKIRLLCAEVWYWALDDCQLWYGKDFCNFELPPFGYTRLRPKYRYKFLETAVYHYGSRERRSELAVLPSILYLLRIETRSCPSFTEHALRSIIEL